jgi:hypothetical protein
VDLLVVEGDITDQQVDVLVNAVNSSYVVRSLSYLFSNTSVGRTGRARKNDAVLVAEHSCEPSGNMPATGSAIRHMYQ